VFYDIYARLCAEKGVSPSRAAVEMGFYRSSVSYWKNKGGSPGKKGLKKIAEYFGVSEEYLAGADSTGGKSVKAAESKPSGHKKAAVKAAEKKSGTTVPEKRDISATPGKASDRQDESGKTEQAKTERGRLEHKEDMKYKDIENIKPAQKPEGDDAGEQKPDFALAVEMAKAVEYIKEAKQERPGRPGDRIRLLRKQQGLSAGHVAKAVDVDINTYLMWESGEIKDIRRYKLGKLARTLGTTIEYISGEDGFSDIIRGIGEPDMGPFIELISTRGECLALLLMARDMSREEVEMAISFMRSLKSE